MVRPAGLTAGQAIRPQWNICITDSAPAARMAATTGAQASIWRWLVRRACPG